jgi:GntR family transcriptional regulator
VVTDRLIASLFGKPSHSPFLHLVRVRYGNQTPMTRETAWYDVEAAPALGHWDGQGSAYELFRSTSGLQLSTAEQTVEAVLSSSLEDEAFGFASPQPCLLFKRKTFTDQNVMVEYVEGVFRGDAYVYRLTLN